jgi:hypothetical protein
MDSLSWIVFNRIQTAFIYLNDFERVHMNPQSQCFVAIPSVRVLWQALIAEAKQAANHGTKSDKHSGLGQ